MNPFRNWSRVAVWGTVAIAAVVVIVGGFSVAALGASREYDGRLMPGVRIAGLDVGGMEPDGALRLVRESLRPKLSAPFTVRWEDETWSTSPKALGVRANAAAVVEAAREASRSVSFLDRVQVGLLGKRIEFERDVELRYPRRKAAELVAEIASEVDKPARDARLDGSSGWVEIIDERDGRKVDVKASRKAIVQALRAGDGEAEVAVKDVEPEVTADSFDKVLLLRIGENRLYLYEDGDITRKWKVATGQPEYPTPQGVFHVELKRYMPTWVNPDPGGWGAGMPASIPPGPGNPLGLRALNWSAPLIRFHGTSAEYSLGYNASHGCVRMSNDAVVELYDLVDVGTPIVSVQAGALKPLYSSSAPDPIVVDEDAQAPVSEDQDSDTSTSGGSGKKKG